MGQNMDQQGKEMAGSTQSSIKGKGKLMGVGRGKGRRLAAVEKGKAKIIISTGHKAVKRSKGGIEEFRFGGKKAKVAEEGNTERMVFGDLKSMEFTIIDDTQKGTQIDAGEGEDERNAMKDKEAEAGDSQPRLKP